MCVSTGGSCKILKKDLNQQSLLCFCFQVTSPSYAEAPWPSLQILTLRCDILVQHLIAQKLSEKGKKVDSKMEKYQPEKPKCDFINIKLDYWDIGMRWNGTVLSSTLVYVQVCWIYEQKDLNRFWQHKCFSFTTCLCDAVQFKLSHIRSFPIIFRVPFFGFCLWTCSMK